MDTSADEERCEPCRIAASLGRRGELYPLTSHWTLNAAVEWSGRPWFVLQTRRHRRGMADLDDAEAAELGLVGRAVTAAVLRVVPADRVYVLLMNEAEPPHVHFHVVARLAGDPVAVRGGALLGTEAPAGTGWSPELAAVVGETTRRLLAYQPQGSSG